MPQEFFYKNISRCNRNFLIANLLFTLVLIVIVNLYFSQFFYNMLLGPFSLDSASLQAIPESSYTFNYDLMDDCYIIQNKFFFRLEGQEVLDFYTIGKEQVSKLELLDAYYMLLKIDDKYLVVKTLTKKAKKSYSGVISNLLAKALWDVDSRSGGKITEADLYPYMLNTIDNYQTYWRSIIFALLFGLNLANYFRVFRRIVNYKNHPLHKRLGRYGNEPEVIASIDDEVKKVGGKVPKKGLTTPSWIIRKGLFKVEIERNPVCRIE